MLQFNKELHKDMPHFIIPGTLPSLNDFFAANKRSPYVGAKMKRDYEMISCNAIRRGLKRFKTEKPIIIHYLVFEPTQKRDHDNVISGIMKCVQDALQKCNVIPNDGWKNVHNFTHDFFLDREKPRIEVYIEVLEDI